MTTVMDRYGGIHEWDLTVPEVQVALYVRFDHEFSLSMADLLLVVQCYLHRVRLGDDGHEINDSNALPASFHTTPSLDRIRHYSAPLRICHRPLLRRYQHC